MTLGAHLTTLDPAEREKKLSSRFLEKTEIQLLSDKWMNLSSGNRQKVGIRPLYQYEVRIVHRPERSHKLDQEQFFDALNFSELKLKLHAKFTK